MPLVGDGELPPNAGNVVPLVGESPGLPPNAGNVVPLVGDGGLPPNAGNVVPLVGESPGLPSNGSPSLLSSNASGNPFGESNTPGNLLWEEEDADFDLEELNAELRCMSLAVSSAGSSGK